MNENSIPKRIAVIPGDGIGPEVVSATLPLIEAAVAGEGAHLVFTELDWGGERYLREKEPMPAGAADQLRAEFDSVLFGAVGRPDIPDSVSSWGLILPLRQQLGLFANVRPVHSIPELPVPVRLSGQVDLVVVRENSEGEYSDIGGRLAASGELGLDVSVHTRGAVRRIARHAFELAGRRRGSVTVATKSNSLRHGYGFWDEVVSEVALDYPDVSVAFAYVDALAASLIQRPESFDVILASNLFGDILSDLASVLQGGLGVAPSANVGARGVPWIYKPVHGSAPDIAGRGVANPVGCILSAAMLLEDCGLRNAGGRLRQAVTEALSDGGDLPPDLGGNATTAQLAERIRQALERVPA